MDKQLLERPHVVVLVDYLIAGGAETMARLLAMHLDGDRFRRTLCVTRAPLNTGPEFAARAELEAAGVGLLALGRTQRVGLRPWQELVRFMREEEVQILHAHKFGSNAWASVLRSFTRTPVVIAHEHTWSYEGRPLRRFLDRELIARRCDLFLAVSQQDRARMIAIEHIDPDRISVLPGGIPDTSPSGIDVRAELGIDRDAPVVVSVAALRAQKAFEVLIAAAAALRQQHPPVRVLIVGDGPERQHLESLIVSAHLEATVIMMGRRQDVVDVLAASDVAVCCSDFEGTPLSILEYMETKTPVVSTEVGGIPDLIEDGVSGFLVPPRSPDELAAHVHKLLVDRPTRERFAERAYAVQQSRFSISATAAKLAELYCDLLQRSGHPQSQPLISEAGRGF